MPAFEERNPLIGIQAIMPLLARLRGHRIDIAPLLLESGLDPNVASIPDARIPLALLDSLWERASVLAGDDCFGLHAGENVAPGSFGILSYLGVSSPTWRAGLERVCRYFRIFSDASSYYLDVSDGVGTIVATHDVPTPGPVRQRVEFTVAVMLYYSRRYVDAEWSPLEVLFEHPEPPDVSEHRRIFTCPLRFRSPTSGFRFEARLLDLPLRGADPSLAAILESVATDKLAASSPTTLAQSLRRIFLELGHGAEMTIEAAARRLGMSVRTVQRRLSGEGTTAKRILDEVRFHGATVMLRRRDVSVADVAFALGFSESAALCRAFKRWTGQSPAAYRRAAPRPASR